MEAQLSTTRGDGYAPLSNDPVRPSLHSLFSESCPCPFVTVPVGLGLGDTTRIRKLTPTPFYLFIFTMHLSLWFNVLYNYLLHPTQLNTPMAHHQGVNAGAYQNLLPFLLMIGVFLLIVWRYVFPALIPPESEPCPTNTEAYWVKPGDSCWAIANGHDCPFERFKELNPEVNCDVLMPGSTICLPIQPTTKPTS